MLVLSPYGSWDDKGTGFLVAMLLGMTVLASVGEVREIGEIEVFCHSEYVCAKNLGLFFECVRSFTCVQDDNPFLSFRTCKGKESKILRLRSE
ncbi:hypothetical protein Y592_04185 [Thermosipho sp. 1070]|nr:hypothetical protein Y592_04185 [Thermosipho sp. 1070]